MHSYIYVCVCVCVCVCDTVVLITHTHIYIYIITKYMAFVKRKITEFLSLDGSLPTTSTDFI
jgi:hypothetical protein